MVMRTKVEIGYVGQTEVARVYAGSLVVVLDTGEEATLPWTRMLGSNDAEKAGNLARYSMGSLINVCVTGIEPSSSGTGRRIFVRQVADSSGKSV
jgi:hypothetical protein